MQGIDKSIRVKPLGHRGRRRHCRGVGSRRRAEMSEGARDTAGMRTVFWIWAGIIAVGLAVMIGLPLGGR